MCEKLFVWEWLVEVYECVCKNITDIITKTITKYLQIKTKSAVWRPNQKRR